MTGEDPTGRERVQNALGEDTSSAAVTRSKREIDTKYVHARNILYDTLIL